MMTLYELFYWWTFQLTLIYFNKIQWIHKYEHDMNIEKVLNKNQKNLVILIDENRQRFAMWLNPMILDEINLFWRVRSGQISNTKNQVSGIIRLTVNLYIVV